MAEFQKENSAQIKLVALDLDGTLSQHKQHLPEANKAALRALAERYRLLMVGAGSVMRIFNQMEGFPVDVIGNYGMQYATFDAAERALKIVRDDRVACDRGQAERTVTLLRKRYGFERFAGENVEYHASGCITFPILGTGAALADKLSFDPDRSKRRAIYREVAEAFPAYNVFVGGSSSYDLAPKPYNKVYALRKYCREHALAAENVVFVGDDYGLGGNDESVYRSEFPYLAIDDFTDFPEVIKPLL